MPVEELAEFTEMTVAGRPVEKTFVGFFSKFCLHIGQKVGKHCALADVLSQALVFAVGLCN